MLEASSPGTKRLQYEADYTSSSSSRAEVKTAWKFYLYFSECLHDVMLDSTQGQLYLYVPHLSSVDILFVTQL